MECESIDHMDETTVNASHQCAECGRHICDDCICECSNCHRPLCGECLSECDCCSATLCPDCIQCDEDGMAYCQACLNTED